MKFSETRIMGKLKPWVRKMQARSPVFTLVGNGIHFKDFALEHLDHLDKFLGGGQTILTSSFVENEVSKIFYMSIGPTAKEAWGEYCKATNLLFPTLARRHPNPLVIMEQASRNMREQQRLIQEDHQLLLPHFEWKAKDERRDEDEYNYLFNGALVFKNGKVQR